MNNLAEKKLKLAAVAVSGLLLLQLLWGGGRLLFLSAPDPVVPVGSVMASELVHFRAPALAGDNEIVERPLFWQGRKAFVYSAPSIESEEDDTTVPANAPINKVKLVGLYSGETPGVIVKLAGERHRVAINESLKGWTLTLISADEAVFEKGEKTRKFELQHSASTASKLPQKSAQSDKAITQAEAENKETGK